MTRVLHLFDSDAEWEQRVAVTQILERVSEPHSQFVASLDVQVPDDGWFPGCNVVRMPERLGIGLERPHDRGGVGRRALEMGAAVHVIMGKRNGDDACVRRQAQRQNGGTVSAPGQTVKYRCFNVSLSGHDAFFEA